MIDEKDIRTLWERMTMIYGHKWVTAYGESDDGTWLSLLRAFSREGLVRGLRKSVENFETWPPTLPEFRNLCRDEEWQQTVSGIRQRGKELGIEENREFPYFRIEVIKAHNKATGENMPLALEYKH